MREVCSPSKVLDARFASGTSAVGVALESRPSAELLVRAASQVSSRATVIVPIPVMPAVVPEEVVGRS